MVWGDAEDDMWTRMEADWLVGQFRQVLGVELTMQLISPEELDAMMADDPRRWPQIGHTWWYSSLPDPHHWLRYWTCGSEFFATGVGYCNPAYDALVERAERELDPEERIRLAEKSQRLLLADIPAIFAYHWDYYVMVKPNVTGYTTGPNQGWPGAATPLTIDIAPAT